MSLPPHELEAYLRLLLDNYPEELRALLRHQLLGVFWLMRNDMRYRTDTGYRDALDTVLGHVAKGGFLPLGLGETDA